MIPLILSPIWNLHIYQLELDHQKRRIWLDNSAIRLGAKDRNLFNQLEKLKKNQEKLHVAYHRALACALIPKTALACIELVKETRALLISMTKNIELTSQFQWNQNRKEASKLITEKGYEMTISRSGKIPLDKKRCHVCHGDFELTFSLSEKKTEMTAISPPVLKSILTLEKNREGLWDYRLQ